MINYYSSKYIYIHRNRYVKKNKSHLLPTAEIKMLIICCCYVILGLGASLAYAISSVQLIGLNQELFNYFECECLGSNTNQMPCDRRGYERFINPVLITVGYSLIALYPIITLIYIIKFSALKNCFLRLYARCSHMKILSSTSSSSDPS